VLKFYKHNKSQRAFAVFGTYVNNHLNGKPYFKVFLKQQIVNFSKNKKFHKHLVTDTIELRGNILDGGDNVITSKVYFNESKIENLIIGKFFNKALCSSPVIIAGSGNSCTLKSLFIRNNENVNNLDKTISTINNLNNDLSSKGCCTVF